jgi:hypothetical protein
LSIRCFQRFKLLASGVALTLLALLPTTAPANPPGEKVYDPAVPTIESDPTEKAPKPETRKGGHPVDSTKAAATQPARSPAPKTAEDAPRQTPTRPNAEPEPKERDRHQEVPPVKTQNQPPAGGVKASEVSSAGVSESAADGDGPSPVVPILVAVALLAAASIGFVLYRERNGQTGTSET